MSGQAFGVEHSSISELITAAIECAAPFASDVSMRVDVTGPCGKSLLIEMEQARRSLVFSDFAVFAFSGLRERPISLD
jgi:hypothetical protein